MLFKPAKSIQNILRLFSLNKRSINTTAPKRGGGGHDKAAVAHHDAHHVAPKDNLFMKLLAEPVHPREHTGYFYREAGNLQGRTNTAISKLGIICAWWFVFYNLISEPAILFGHGDYPDTSKWTNEELGIPGDDE